MKLDLENLQLNFTMLKPELRYVFKSRIAQHLSMKEGSLFCSYEIHQTRMLQIVFLVSLESSQPGGVHGLWFPGVWTAVQKVLEY